MTGILARRVRAGSTIRIIGIMIRVKPCIKSNLIGLLIKIFKILLFNRITIIRMLRTTTSSTRHMVYKKMIRRNIMECIINNVIPNTTPFYHLDSIFF